MPPPPLSFQLLVSLAVEIRKVQIGGSLTQWLLLVAGCWKLQKLVTLPSCNHKQRLRAGCLIGSLGEVSNLAPVCSGVQGLRLKL
jgi:hypothetical protein